MLLSFSKDLLKKLDECTQIVNSAKKRQEAEANKNASILLEELDYEKKKEERRKAAAQKKRDKKKQKKKKKTTTEKQFENEANDNEDDDEKEDEDVDFDRVKFPFVTSEERTPVVINGNKYFDIKYPKKLIKTF